MKSIWHTTTETCQRKVTDPDVSPQSSGTAASSSPSPNTFKLIDQVPSQPNTSTNSNMLILTQNTSPSPPSPAWPPSPSPALSSPAASSGRNRCPSPSCLYLTCPRKSCLCLQFNDPARAHTDLVWDVEQLRSSCTDGDAFLFKFNGDIRGAYQHCCFCF